MYDGNWRDNAILVALPILVPSRVVRRRGGEVSREISRKVAQIIEEATKGESTTVTRDRDDINPESRLNRAVRRGNGPGAMTQWRRRERSAHKGRRRRRRGERATKESLATPTWCVVSRRVPPALEIEYRGLFRDAPSRWSSPGLV